MFCAVLWATIRQRVEILRSRGMIWLYVDDIVAHAPSQTYPARYKPHVKALPTTWAGTSARPNLPFTCHALQARHGKNGQQASARSPPAQQQAGSWTSPSCLYKKTG